MHTSWPALILSYPPFCVYIPTDADPIRLQHNVHVAGATPQTPPAQGCPSSPRAQNGSYPPLCAYTPADVVPVHQRLNPHNTVTGFTFSTPDAPDADELDELNTVHPPWVPMPEATLRELEMVLARTCSDLAATHATRAVTSEEAASLEAEVESERAAKVARDMFSKQRMSQIGKKQTSTDDVDNLIEKAEHCRRRVKGKAGRRR
ncbi:hypothetical protein BOTBODRAFT_368156 [Botryobasidium botryosum FD-172 SS1]|uniref:Uncharacterized protein n=1 Tax=Botryobasidium botryosum (strain FD-172 SS1) TaxID=930990 RepID=A0A067MFI4_BOTB1|nr:hypothetical protein BOTBODRAFT_368156 [Botryobasidium botryosum FD-172 SS1]